MTPLQRRIARARLLRRQGKTYAEIRAVVGDVSDDRLHGWLVGIPRPRETWRSSPKTELRRECRRLRAQGYTYTEISAITGASAGSISPWVRDVVPRSNERAEAARLAGVRTAARNRSDRADRRRETHERTAAASIGPLSAKHLFILGVGLYWAEGSKSKPYALRERITFINSDPTMVEVFLAWLRLVGVRLADCKFRVSIHETADIDAAEFYWAGVVGVDRSALSRTTIKRHNPKTNRLNYSDRYQGCLTIDVRLSAKLYRSVAGWWSGLHRQIVMDTRRSADWSDVPPWRGWQAYAPGEA